MGVTGGTFKGVSGGILRFGGGKNVIEWKLVGVLVRVGVLLRTGVLGAGGRGAAELRLLALGGVTEATLVAF